MHPDQLAKNAPGRLVKVGSGGEAFWHFVPDPLPPKLTYGLAFARELAAAERAVGRLAGLGQALENPQLFVHPFIRQEAVASSRIEGTESDLRDLLIYEVSGRPRPGGPPEADVREVLNYVHALEYGLARLDSLPVCLRLVREVHERLMAGVRGRSRERGEFRTGQNRIGGSSARTARYVPPPVTEMDGCLHQLESYLQETGPDDPLVRLACIHYQFEAVHPFWDGNGRIGRLLLVLLTVHWGLLSLPLLYLSAFFEEYRRDYYDLLLGVSTDGRWAEWLRFFLKAIEVQSRDALERAKSLEDLRRRWRELFHGTRASVRLLHLVDSLFENPYLTVRDAAHRTEVTYAAAQQHVRRLAEEGVLEEVSGVLNPRLYVAAEVLSCLRR
ncbi:MAG: Fic family protein [Armatimonadetes bacterium]|nr:Fic family protein [Armatimonadota bacterium]